MFLGTGRTQGNKKMAKLAMETTLFISTTRLKELVAVQKLRTRPSNSYLRNPLIELFIAPRKKMAILTQFHVYPCLKTFNLYRPHCCSALSVRQEGFGFLDKNLCIVTYASNTMMLNEESLTFVIAKYLWNSKTKC